MGLDIFVYIQYFGKIVSFKSNFLKFFTDCSYIRIF